MTITKPTVGSTNWNVATDAVIDRVNELDGIESTISAKQPLDSDLTAIAGLTPGSGNVMAADGSGWISKTYAALKTALSLVKGDVGLGNVDNTSNATERATTATLTNKTLTSPVINTPTGIASTDISGLAESVRDTIGTALVAGTNVTIVVDDAGDTITINSSGSGSGGGGTVTSVTAGDSTITIGGTGPAPTVAVNAIPESKVTNLVTDLAAKQPLDSDLTTIAGLTATTDSFLQSKASAWTTRTPAQVKTDLAITPADIGAQPADTDLTTIAGLTATTDNFMVGASSAWASRTPTQAKTALAIAVADVSGAAPLASPTFTGTTTTAGLTINGTMTAGTSAIGATVTTYLAATQTKNNSTTLINLPGLALTVVPGTYVFDGTLFWNSPVTPKIDFKVTSPASTSCTWGLLGVVISAGSYTGDVITVAQDSSNTNTGVGNASGVLTFGTATGWAVVTNSGTLQFQFAQSVATAVNTTVNLGSFIRWTRVA